MMDANKMREEFESAIPVPEGVHWDAGRNQYWTSTHHVPCVGYRGAWQGWKASRESQVIELPNPAETLAGPTLYAQFKEAVEASGATVKVAL